MGYHDTRVRKRVPDRAAEADLSFRKTNTFRFVFVFCFFLLFERKLSEMYFWRKLQVNSRNFRGNDTEKANKFTSKATTQEMEF